jgi:hypothetical protein
MVVASVKYKRVIIAIALLLLALCLWIYIYNSDRKHLKEIENFVNTISNGMSLEKAKLVFIDIKQRGGFVSVSNEGAVYMIVCSGKTVYKAWIINVCDNQITSVQ